MTVRLWQALNRPPAAHPFFQRLLDESNHETWEHVRTALWLITGIVAGSMLIVAPVVFFMLIVMGPLMYAVLNTLFYTALWTMDIAGTVARELSRHTYDIQCPMPVGTLGVNWMVALGRVHYKNGLMRSLLDVFSVLQLLLIAMVFVLLGLVVTRTPNEQIQLLQVVIVLLSLMAFIYVDHIQSTLCGVFIGLICGRHTRTAGDARIWALVCFIALQLAWYLGLLLVIGLVVPFGLSMFEEVSALTHLVMPGLVLGIMFGLREALVRRLWWSVLRGANAEQYELILLDNYKYAASRD